MNNTNTAINGTIDVTGSWITWIIVLLFIACMIKYLVFQ
jgi:hypothetical protein